MRRSTFRILPQKGLSVLHISSSRRTKDFLKRFALKNSPQKQQQHFPHNSNASGAFKHSHTHNNNTLCLWEQLSSSIRRKKVFSNATTPKSSREGTIEEEDQEDKTLKRWFFFSGKTIVDRLIVYRSLIASSWKGTPMSAVSREEGKANVKEKGEALRGSFSPLFYLSRSCSCSLSPG